MTAAEDQAYQELTAAAVTRGLSHSRSALSDSRHPSSVIASRSTGSIGSSLSGSFLSRSTGTAAGSAHGPRPPVSTQSVSVQSDLELPHVCARCSRPARTKSSCSQSLPCAAIGGFPRLQRMGTSARRRRNVSLNTQKVTHPQFAETPRSSQMMCVLSALEHINCRGEGCCPYHIGCANLALILQEMCSSECMSEFSPADGWQCHDCQSLNGLEGLETAAACQNLDASRALLECEVCGKHTPAVVPAALLSQLDVREASKPSLWAPSQSSTASSYRSEPENSSVTLRGLKQPTPMYCAPRSLLSQPEQSANYRSLPASLAKEASKAQRALMPMPSALAASQLATASTELPIGSAAPSSRSAISANSDLSTDSR